MIAAPPPASRRDLRRLAVELEPGYRELREAAELFADQQDARIRDENRLRAFNLERSLRDAHLEHQRLVERRLSKALVTRFQEVAPPGVRHWVARTPGVGAHTVARLLGQTGHPRLAAPLDWAEPDGEGARELVRGEPRLRTLAQLWAYCGVGDASRRWHTGMTREQRFALGNPRCRALVHVLATGVVKAQLRENQPPGALGAVYLSERERYAARGHLGACTGGWTVTVDGRKLFACCKTAAGRRASTGDPYSRGHLHAIALRHLAKRLLAELFDAAWEPWCDTPPDGGAR